MAWTTGTHTGYRDFLSQLVTFANAHGWTTMRSLTNFSWNSITDEREIVLQGASGNATPPVIGFRTFTESGVQAILLAGFTSYSAAAFASIPGASPFTSPSASGGTYVPVLSSGSFWLSVTPRRICGVVKCVGGVTSYISFYAGLLNPFKTEVEDAYPFALFSSCGVSTQAPDSTSINITGISECASPPSVSGPCYFYRSSDGTWQQVRNNENNAEVNDFVVYPLGRPRLFTTPDELYIAAEFGLPGLAISNNTRSAPSRKLLPTPMSGGDLHLPMPLTLIATPVGSGGSTDKIVGELHGCYWISAAKSDASSKAAEDTVTVGGRVFRCFWNGAQTAFHQMFALEQA